MAEEKKQENKEEKSKRPSVDNDLFTGKLESIYLTDVRVYVAGVLMPTTRVTVTSSVNEMPRAQISLPAYSELLYLGEMDRVPVQVFVRETMVECPEFILLFEGFIASTQYINSAIQRSVVINCLSVFDILNDIRISFLQSLPNMLMPVAPSNTDFYMFSQACGLMTFPAYLIFYGLVKPDGTQLSESDTPQEIKVPSDYLANVYAFLQKSGKSEDDEEPPLKALHDSALTQFYGKYARIFNFMKRFVRVPYFDEPVEIDGEEKYAWNIDSIQTPDYGTGYATFFPMIYGLRINTAIDLIKNRLSQYAGQMTFMQLLQFLIDEMEYDYLIISNPAYHAPKEEEEEKSENKQEASQSEEGKEDEKDRGTLVSSVVKPFLTDTMPPGCNIMYRSMVNNVSTEFVHKGVPTRVRANLVNSALGKLVGTSPETIAQVALLDYYPSKKYKTFRDAQNAPQYIKFMTDELLEDEKYTGPWIADIATPKWAHYVAPEVIEQQPKLKVIVDGVEDEVDASASFIERFFRRQLLSKKYLVRNIQVTGMFDPYITPGFPGVVYDNAGAGFAFAGHVVTVAHTIMPGDISTNVVMNFVRPLAEAATVEIPNPLSMIEQVTHKSERLTEIYDSILGTPKVHMNGTEARTFEDLKESAGGTDSANDPNNNPREAYLAKRRNIVTFERYCKFMNLTFYANNVQEGTNSPKMLYGKFVEDRRPIDVSRREIIWDPIIPEQEQNIPAKKEEAKSSEGEKKSSTGEQKSASEKVKEKAEEKKEKKKKVVRVNEQIDVRQMLMFIADKEFSRVIYK